MNVRNAAEEPQASVARVRAAAIGGAFLVIAVLEEVRPLRKRVESKSRHVVRDLTIAALSAAATLFVQDRLVAPVAERFRRRRLGLLNLIRLPRRLRLLAGVLLLDYTLWIWHRLNHRVPALWRFHRVHHVDLDLDSWTGLRFHFGEMALAGIVRILQIRLTGADAAAMTVWQTLLLPSIFFHHSKIELPWRVERLLSLLVVTPRMHAIHHSNVREEADSNWASLFTIWDLAHRSFRLDVPQERITIGVARYGRPEDVTIGRVLALPLRPTAGDWKS